MRYKLPDKIRRDKVLLEKTIKDLENGIKIMTLEPCESGRELDIAIRIRKENMEKTLQDLKEAINRNYPEPYELFKELLK